MGKGVGEEGGVGKERMERNFDKLLLHDMALPFFVRKEGGKDDGIIAIAIASEDKYNLTLQL